MRRAVIKAAASSSASKPGFLRSPQPQVGTTIIRQRHSFRTADPELIVKDRPRKASATDPLLENPQPWEDPWRYAFGPPPPPPKYTAVVESTEEWQWVRRLLPVVTIPEPPIHDVYPTPSGWVPPKVPSPDLPYHIARTPFHTFPLYLQTRRDLLDPKTLEFDYDELVIMKNIDGDVFACDADLKQFLEQRLGHPVATNVRELQGKIWVKGADRTDLEAFLLHCGF